MVLWFFFFLFCFLWIGFSIARNTSTLFQFGISVVGNFLFFYHFPPTIPFSDAHKEIAKSWKNREKNFFQSTIIKCTLHTEKQRISIVQWLWRSTIWRFLQFHRHWSEMLIDELLNDCGFFFIQNSYEKYPNRKPVTWRAVIIWFIRIPVVHYYSWTWNRK